MSMPYSTPVPRWSLPLNSTGPVMIIRGILSAGNRRFGELGSVVPEELLASVRLARR